MNILELIGKKIIAIKGTKNPDKRKTRQTIPLEFILLDDGETIISFEEQDYYSYHDCSPSARHMNIRKDSALWSTIMTHPLYADSTVAAEFPF